MPWWTYWWQWWDVPTTTICGCCSWSPVACWTVPGMEKIKKMATGTLGWKKSSCSMISMLLLVNSSWDGKKGNENDENLEHGKHHGTGERSKNGLKRKCQRGRVFWSMLIADWRFYLEMGPTQQPEKQNKPQILRLNPQLSSFQAGYKKGEKIAIWEGYWCVDSVDIFYRKIPYHLHEP